MPPKGYVLSASEGEHLHRSGAQAAAGAGAIPSGGSVCIKIDPSKGAAEAVLHILHQRAFVRTPRQVDHAHSMLADHGFFGVVFEILSDDQDHFAIAVPLRVGEGNVGCERNVTAHFLPQKTELIDRKSVV